ncbi:hypothetical protein BSM4216_2439 [Bacillus smithii]|nr:hypothetical protein BSM4216_2439 [Bacillus smithii]
MVMFIVFSPFFQVEACSRFGSIQPPLSTHLQNDLSRKSITVFC